MISPTKQADSVLVDGLSGERRQFTIMATGKAFRTLIDGLYSNKIGAVVREIISNGYDSHAAAQIGDVPVAVTAPTNMDPIFKVRDYGVSMDHDTVMDLYSTIFKSSKESSNEQVGMFGLGSKSPFAYTDSFTVTTYLDGTKRVYVAHIANGDIPQITHVGDEPTMEPNGVEVTVPVQVHDIRTFHHEIKRNILASSVTPMVDGMGTDIPEPLAQGDGWRIYDDEYGIGRVGIRQGCVIYPLHNMSVQAVSYGYSVVVDVPIGTVDVTASRESLSLTPETTQVVREALAEVDNGVREWGSNLKFENRLDEFRKARDYAFLSFPIGRNRVNLVPDKHNPNVPAQEFTYFKSARKTGVLTQTDDPQRWTFLVERDGEKVLRKNLRIAAEFKRQGSKHLALINARDLPRAVRLLGLARHQVVPLSTLPDVDVVRNYSGGGGGYTSANPNSTAAPRKMPPGTFWVPKEGARRIDLQIGNFTCSLADELRFLADWTVLGFSADLHEVIFLTEKQAKALGAPQSRLFGPEVLKRAEKYAKKHNLQAKADKVVEYNAHQQYIRNLEATTKSLLGIPRYDYSVLPNHINSLVAQSIMDEFAPIEPKGFTTADQHVLKFFPVPGNYSLAKSVLDDRVKELVSPFEALVKGGNEAIVTLLKFYSENQ